MKTHKTPKSKRMRGKGMGTHGGGARKNRKGSGHRGGIGMSGTGKRADHKKTLITKLYGNEYFGRKGITSRGTRRDKRKRINLYEIETNLNNYIKKGIAKKAKEGYEINLPNSKILGKGDVNHKLIIKAEQFSKTAKEKVEKAGGKIETAISRKSESKEAEQNES